MNEPVNLPQFPLTNGPIHSDAREELSTLTFLEILRHMRRRKVLIASVTFLISAAALAALLAMTPHYNAEAVLRIESSPKHLLPIPVLSGDLPADKQTLWADIAAESERMVSWPLLSQLVDRLDLANDPELNPRSDDGWMQSRVSELLSYLRTVFRKPSGPSSPDAVKSSILKRLSSNLVSSVDANTGLMHVTYTSRDPQHAADVVNTLTQIYMDDELSRHRREDQKTIQWLGTTLSQLQKDATSAKRAVADYSASSGIYGVNGQSTASAQMGHINDALAGAMADESAIASRLAQVTGVGLDAESLQNLPEALQSPTRQELRKIEAALTAQLASLKSRLGDSHPQVEALRAQVGDLQAAIRGEITRVASALENQLRGARERTHNLQEQLQKSEHQVAGVNQAELKLRELEDVARSRDSIFQVFLQRANELSAQLGSDLLNVSVVSPARVPDRPSSPKIRMIEMFVIFGSFVTTSLIVVARELYERGFATVEEIELRCRVRCIGLMPSLERDSRGRCKVNEGVGVLCLDMLKTAWARLRRLGTEEKANVFLVTSSIPDEGKTTTVLAIARTGARHGARVLVVDCDLVRGALTKQVEPSGIDGLVEVLEGQAAWRQALRKDPVSSAHVLTNGLAGKRSSLLDTPVMEALLAEVSKEYDLVLLDAPPVLGSSDAECLSRFCDATILLVRWRKTPQRVVVSALRQLSANPVFCLLSRVDLRQYSVFNSREFVPLIKAYHGRRLALEDAAGRTSNPSHEFVY